MGTILVIGALGQIGSELTQALRERHGDESVVAADVKGEHDLSLRDSGACLFADVTQPETIVKIIDGHGVRTVYHMAAILSAVGETNPQLAWSVNVSGLYNVLEIARQYELDRVYWPSSMAVFGRGVPRDKAPQETVLRPATMYGLTKVTGELMCNYYYQRYGLDVRGLRYPGIISSETLPGGGTTDYAVEIFYEAVRSGRYVCFVRGDTVLPMMYMPDCIRATLMLMEADLDGLRYHADYNLSALSFSVAELVDEIRKHMPGFECVYRPDFRQEIASSWPRTIDDSAARSDWGWSPEYDLAAMTTDMLSKLGEKHSRRQVPAGTPAAIPIRTQNHPGATGGRSQSHPQQPWTAAPGNEARPQEEEEAPSE